MNNQAEIDPGIRVRMCAAMWGVCYSNDREFDTDWKSVENGLLVLADAAENGLYSWQVEGVLVRHLVSRPPMINYFNLSAGEDGHAQHMIKRSDWTSDLANEAQWEVLRADLYGQFYDGGSGFLAHDLKFADLAIDWLKAGRPCEASTCSKLPLSLQRNQQLKFQ